MEVGNKKWSRRERGIIQETFEKKVDHYVASLVDNFHQILSSSSVSLTGDQEVRCLHFIFERESVSEGKETKQREKNWARDRILNENV